MKEKKQPEKNVSLLEKPKDFFDIKKKAKQNQYKHRQPA